MTTPYHPPIFHYTSVDSTNDEALRLIDLTPPPYFVTAARQTAGRGRMGRRWHSPEGNLYCTGVFSANIPLTKLPLFTLYSALKVCDAISQYTKVPLWLKWPNDLWVGMRKCAGFLAESPVAPKVGRLLLLGVGLNVNTTDFPEEIVQTATSLKRETQRDWSIDEIKKVLCGAVASAYGNFYTDNFKEELKSLWSRYEKLSGKEIKFEESGTVYTGKVLSLAPDGALVVQTGKKTHELRSGEVTLSKFLRE